MKILTSFTVLGLAICVGLLGPVISLNSVLRVLKYRQQMVVLLRRKRRLDGSQPSVSLFSRNWVKHRK